MEGISATNMYMETSNKRENIEEDFSIKFQEGTIPEYGVNGLQLETALQQVLNRLVSYNNSVPCRENSIVITKLEESIMWLNKRTNDRIARNVEGTNKL